MCPPALPRGHKEWSLQRVCATYTLSASYSIVISVISITHVYVQETLINSGPKAIGKNNDNLDILKRNYKVLFLSKRIKIQNKERKPKIHIRINFLFIKP